MLLTVWGRVIKNIDGMSKTRRLINNLTKHQKYQTSFVTFDAESNFKHIYPMFTLRYHFSVLTENKQL